MPNTYYSGQGSLYIAERNETLGIPLGFIPIGNVSELTLNIETTKFEHKESESGSRLIDLTIIKEKKGTFEFKLENLSLDNLSLALWGTKATVASGTVASGTPEIIKVPKNVVGGMRFPLKYPKVSTVVVKDSAGTVTHATPADYTVDAQNGNIIITAGGAIETAAKAVVDPATTVDIKVSYAYAAHVKTDAFTQSNPLTRWLRFEGLNTIDNSLVIIDMFKGQFDPMTGYGLINEDLANVSMKGSILSDSLQTSGSKFFRQVNV